MPEELGEGLYLAAVGMGLVFLSLVAFMLILFALRKLFPGEEVAEAVEIDQDPVATAIRKMEVQAQPVSEEPAPAVLQEPSTVAVSPTDGRIPGVKIAAMAVALYLAMERGEQFEQAPVETSAWNPSQSHSDWSSVGRTALWESQGHRPQAYGQRSQSAYSTRDRLRG